MIQGIEFLRFFVLDQFSTCLAAFGNVMWFHLFQHVILSSTHKQYRYLNVLIEAIPDFHIASPTLLQRPKEIPTVIPNTIELK